MEDIVKCCKHTTAITCKTKPKQKLQWLNETCIEYKFAVSLWYVNHVKITTDWWGVPHKKVWHMINCGGNHFTKNSRDKRNKQYL